MTSLWWSTYSNAFTAHSVNSRGHLDNRQGLVIFVRCTANMAKKDSMAADAAEGILEKLTDLVVPVKAQRKSVVIAKENT